MEVDRNVCFEVALQKQLRNNRSPVLGGWRTSETLAFQNFAKVTQLVECHPSKVDVAGSMPVFRSKV